MISVIIPVLNAEKYIDNCLRSVLTQENAEYEVIIINDGSTDQTASICREWNRHYGNILYLEQENQGQGSARNHGITNAHGEWLVFLDADDELMPGALHRLQEMAVEETDIICYEFFLRKDLRGHEEEHICLYGGTYRCSGDLLRASTSFLWDKMFRAEFWKKSGILLGNLYGEDFEAICLLEACCTRFVLLREPLVRHYEREDNLSSNPAKVMEITRAIENTVKEFIRRNLLESYKIPLFYVVYRQYKLYQEPDFCVFDLGQSKRICRELERIMETYFEECYAWVKRFQKTELILIGKRCQHLYLEMPIFLRSSFFPELETFVLGGMESDAQSMFCLVDLSQEGRCRRFGTRTDEWQRNRWVALAEEFIRATYKPGRPVWIFVFDTPGPHNRELYQILLGKKGIYSIQEGMPVLEKLLSGQSFLYKTGDSGKENPFDKFWCKGEQYRMQFNENILNAWLRLKNQGKGFAPFFTERGYQKAAVYGMGYLGERLVEELGDSGVEMLYCIDRNGKQGGEFPVYTLEDELPKADVIIVTVVHLFFEIKAELERITDIPIVSLEEIIEVLL